jgi:hypothetical protein
MTDMSHWTRVLKRSVTQLVPAALAGTLVVVVAADASAETLEHLRIQLIKPQPKVRAGSLPGHPDKDIARPTVKTKVPPPAPDPRPSGLELPADRSNLEPRTGTHTFHAPVCNGDTCESE